MTLINNVKTFLANNTTPGRMLTFGENFSEAWVNCGKCTCAELAALWGNNSIIGRQITKNESIFKSIGVPNGLCKGEISPVKTSVPRLQYE